MLKCLDNTRMSEQDLDSAPPVEGGVADLSPAWNTIVRTGTEDFHARLHQKLVAHMRRHLLAPAGPRPARARRAPRAASPVTVAAAVFASS